MSRFEVVGPRDLLWETLVALQDTGVCHLEPASLALMGLGGLLVMRRPKR